LGQIDPTPSIRPPAWLASFGPLAFDGGHTAQAFPVLFCMTREGAALAGFYAAADKAPEAKAALAEALKLNPKLSVALLHALQPGFIDSPPGFREALIKAGLPEE